MNWPTSLVKEIASRRVVFFLGSGVSASSQNDAGQHPPHWSALLEVLKGKIKADPILLSEIDALIKKEKFLDAAEIIIQYIPQADLTLVFREQFQTPRFKPSKLHEHILKIGPKIIVTTNYDDIYDQYCKTGDATDGYNICKYYEEHLVSDIRSTIRIIVKAHGCISNPSKMILSKSQYFEEKLNHPNFYNVLNSIFITNTLFFIGYSIADPDIQLLLENSNIVAPKSHPHYAVLPDNISEIEESSLKKIYNIQSIKYEYNNFKQLEDGLNDLKTLVEEERKILS